MSVCVYNETSILICRYKSFVKLSDRIHTYLESLLLTFSCFSVIIMIKHKILNITSCTTTELNSKT